MLYLVIINAQNSYLIIYCSTSG